ncbi:MAG: alanine racemase [Treponema sp.]
MRCTKALIYKENLEHNIKSIRSLLKPNVKMCVALKADGYGCGAVTTAKIAQSLGAGYFAVAAVQEGTELRDNGIKADIILLSLCSKDEVAEAVRHDIIPLVFDKEYIGLFAEAAAQEGKRQRVFLAVDSGMGRLGVYAEEAADIARFIQSSPHLELAGMMTHFAVSDSTESRDKAYTQEQFRAFLDAVESVRRAGVNPGICSCSSSAASLAEPEMQLDMVRPGIAVYGCYPDGVNRDYLARRGVDIALKPVMQFETQVAAIRRVKAGTTVSYGRTWTAQQDTDIAILPAGYADGLLRRFSPALTVAINGRAYPVVGRICMDQCMADIGADNKNVRRWDKAVFFGPKDREALCDAADIAAHSGTISYEIMTGISKRVPRIVV